MGEQERNADGADTDVSGVRTAPYMMEAKVLDRLVDWRLGDPNYNRQVYVRNGLKPEKERQIMMRQFTMELRVDYSGDQKLSEADKNELMRKAWRAAAVHVYAQAGLLATGQKPQIALFSDDFYEGHEEIALLTDELGAAIVKDDSPEVPISDEMMALANEKS